MLFGLGFFLPAFVFAQDAISAVDPIFPSWMIDESGTHFEINNNPFLDLTVDSSENVQLQIESMPEMVVMIIESDSSAISSQISVKGLEPSTTYYKYEDSYQNSVTIDTSSSGTLTFSQDLSVPHIIFIQKNKSTKFIRDDLTGGDCTTIGIWDVTTKTCTLTTDVFETIQIDSNDITLDGNGHSIFGGGIGVFLVRKTGVTVENLNVRGFNSGILLFSSNFNNLLNNSLRPNLTGISLSGTSNNNTISGNNVSLGEIGISLLRGTGNNNVINNTTSNNRNGISLGQSDGNSLINNVANSNSRSGISLSASKDNVLTDNIVQENGEVDLGFGASQLIDCANTIQGTIGSGNKPFEYFNSVVDLNNKTLSGLILCDADDSKISGVAVAGSGTKKNNGISLHFTDNSIIENTTSSDNRQGISFFNSTNNIVNNSTFAENALRGIFVVSRSPSNEIVNNNFINNAFPPFVQTRSESVFNLPLPVGGNHWSRFDSPAEGCGDADNNSICDAPFVFSGGQDNFPFVNRDGWKIPIVREPVVIVPGIIGTKLNRVLDGKEVWPRVNTMITSSTDDYLDELKLTVNGTQTTGKEMNPSRVIEEESVLFFNFVFYKNLIDNFKNQGYVEGTTLFTVPYDWRLDIQDEVNRLDSVIQQAIAESLNGKIDIIAHSMGGLLVKELLANATSTVFVNKLILAGVPQLGASGTFKILNFGDNLGFELGPIDILNSERVKIISQNMPGVHELLPSERYVQINGGYVKDFRNGIQILDFDQTEQFMIDDGRNPLLLSEADAFHQGLDNQAFNAPEVHNIMGCQNPETIFGFNIYDNNVIDVTRDQGDGTVPLTSAINLSGDFTNYFALHNETNIDHLDLIRDSRPIDLINDIINETGDPLPQGISTSTIDCFDTPAVSGNETTISFSLHSPAQLNVFDSQNNHTGFNEDGDIDLQIPGSSFETINGNSFALVPAGDTYRVEIQALSEGDFTLKTKTFNGVAIIDAVTYVNIPLPSNQTQAELTFTDTQGNLTLNVDNDGDDIIDVTFQPNAILDATSSLDITPPDITIVSIPPEILLNTDFVFTFNATDDLSGVEVLKATLDGNPVSSGDTITLSEVGDHLFRVEVTDKAGNPRVEEIGFKVVYDFGGFLSPLQKKTLVFQAGRSIPVKFQLRDVNNSVISNASASLFFAFLTNGESGTFQPAVSKGKANIENQFRFDQEEQQYVYNLNTKSLTPGDYRLRVDLDDETSKFIDVELRSNK